MGKCVFFSWKNALASCVALSEHGFYAPKHVTISPGLTITKARIWGPKPFKMSKSRNQFLISLADFGPFSGPLEAQMT